MFHITSYVQTYTLNQEKEWNECLYSNDHFEFSDYNLDINTNINMTSGEISDGREGTAAGFASTSVSHVNYDSTTAQ